MCLIKMYTVWLPILYTWSVLEGGVLISDRSITGLMQAHRKRCSVQLGCPDVSCVVMCGMCMSSMSSASLVFCVMYEQCISSPEHITNVI